MLTSKPDPAAALCTATVAIVPHGLSKMDTISLFSVSSKCLHKRKKIDKKLYFKRHESLDVPRSSLTEQAVPQQKQLR